MVKKQQEAPAEPLFDSARAALQFALNYVRTRYAQPLMTKTMAEMSAIKKKPKLKRRTIKDPITGEKTVMVTKAPEPELTKRLRGAARPNLRGLDQAAQAGMILLHFAKLSDPKRHALTCAVLRSSEACSCRSPCCSGWRFNQEWLESAEALADYFGQEWVSMSNRSRQHPLLRRKLVQKHYDPKTRINLQELAEACSVSEATVTKYREIIGTALGELERFGWEEFSAHLLESNIVGEVS